MKPNESEKKRRDKGSITRFIVCLIVGVCALSLADFYQVWPSHLDIATSKVMVDLCSSTCDNNLEQNQRQMIVDLKIQRENLKRKQELLEQNIKLFEQKVAKLVEMGCQDKAVLAATASKKHTSDVITVMRTTLRLAEIHGLTRDEAIIRMVEHMKGGSLPIYEKVTEEELKDKELWDELSTSFNLIDNNTRPKL